MLKLSKKTLFALEAVVDIAYNARLEPVQSREITQRQGIPQRYLEQVMQELVRAGILKGVRGPRGGYRLARERRRITAGDIVRVVGTMDENGGVAPPEGSSALGLRVIYPMWAAHQEEFMEGLDSVTLEDLCRQAAKEGVVNTSHENLNFNI